jgi:ribosomal protein L7/L12
MSTEQDLINLRVRVTELENKLDFLYRKFGVEYIDNPGMADSRIISLIKKGNKLEAIKMYRELTNSDLAEAKNAVEKIESTLL